MFLWGLFFFFFLHGSCSCRCGSTATACGWRLRWSTTCVSSAISGLWTGCVSCKRSQWLSFCPVCGVCLTLGGKNHHANHPFNLTVLFFCERRFRWYRSRATPKLVPFTTSASWEMISCCIKVKDSSNEFRMLWKVKHLQISEQKKQNKTHFCLCFVF